MGNNNQPKILIADDDDSWRERICLLMKTEGYNVLRTSTHLETMNELNNEISFDLLILNVILRGEINSDWKFEWTMLMDEAKKKNAPIILITSINQNLGIRDTIEMLKQAFSDYGVKEIFFKDEITTSSLINKVKQLISFKKKSEIPNELSISSETKKPFTKKEDAEFSTESTEKKMPKKEFNMLELITITFLATTAQIYGTEIKSFLKGLLEKSYSEESDNIEKIDFDDIASLKTRDETLNYFNNNDDLKRLVESLKNINLYEKFFSRSGSISRAKKMEMEADFILRALQMIHLQTNIKEARTLAKSLNRSLIDLDKSEEASELLPTGSNRENVSKCTDTLIGIMEKSKKFLIDLYPSQQET